MPDRQFVIVTADHSGLGFALDLQRKRERVVLVPQPDKDEEDLEAFRQVGEGLVPRMPLSGALQRYGRSNEVYWIFDANHNVHTSDKLRQAGRKVLGASTFADKMEHDRHAAQEIAQQAGLSIPKHEEFQTVDEGVKYLEAHADQAFVMKPNAGSSAATCVPDHTDETEANAEIRRRLKKLKPDSLTTGYILQERKKGVEVAVELWVSNGVPCLATVDLESKRKSEGDHGIMIGCSQEVVWTMPLETKLVQQTVAKFLPVLEKERFTGFADCNVIFADRAVWFLEAGFRFAYSATPNLLLSLGLDSFGDLMADFMDGHVDGFARRFKAGFGASVTLILDHPEPGLPITIKDWAEPHFHAYDLAKDEDGLMLTGWSNEVGVYCHHEYTIEQAAEECLSELHVEEAVSYTNIDWRSDLARADYPNSPIRRFQALQSMRLLS